MEQTYEITGMTCQGCANNVQQLIEQMPGVRKAEIDLEEAKAVVTSETEISIASFRSTFDKHGHYTIAELGKGIPKSKSDRFWFDQKKWNRASFNTLNCLIGCSIGDFGMIIFLQAYYPETPLMWQMTLAIIAGLCTSILLETILLKTREHFSWLLALKTAFGMSFISMVAMELAMTSTDFLITGGQAAFDTLAYWLALLPAMLVGFLTPLPYNYYKLKKFDKACH